MEGLRRCRSLYVYESRGWLLLVLTAAIFSVRARADENKLPSARELIAESLKVYADPTESNVPSRKNIAEALAYCGEFANARMILAAHRDDVAVEAGYWKVAQAEIEMTGSAAPFPEVLWKETPDFTRLILATAYAKHGHPEKSLVHLRQISAVCTSALHFGGEEVVQPLLSGGHRVAACEALVLWAGCFEKSESLRDYKLPRKVEQLVMWLVECGEDAKAKSLCERWHQVIKGETDPDENGAAIGLVWARLGTSLASVGDKAGAEKALHKARYWLEAARAARFNPAQWTHCLDYAEAFAAVAVRQKPVLGAEIANNTLARAYEHAQLAIASKFPYLGYEKIVAAQLERDDVEWARQTIEKIRDDRSRAKSWVLISEHAWLRGQQDIAKSAAEAFVQVLDKDGFEPFMAHDMARAGACAAQANEKELARRLFNRALKLSTANEDPKFDHPWIAMQQTLSEMLEDAYSTIKSIPDLDDRNEAIAELACAVAKVEFAAAKTNKK